MDSLEPASREFVAAVEALLDWMNGNDMSADHADQKPQDYKRLCTALERMTKLSPDNAYSEQRLAERCARAEAALEAKDAEIAKAKEDRAAYERWTAEIKDAVEALRAANVKLRAGMTDALAMILAFASGAGFSASGAAEYDRLKAIANEQTVTTEGNKS